MKKLILAAFLVACFVTLAMAQDHQPATFGVYSGLPQIRSTRPPFGRTGCPEFKSPYYYAGDFDWMNQYANGLSNEADLQVSKGSQVYQAFLAKGRMLPLMETIPVRVITNDKTALLGAGRYAALRSGQIKPSHP